MCSNTNNRHQRKTMDGDRFSSLLSPTGSTLDIRRLEEPSDITGTPNVQRPMSNFEVTPTGDEMQTMKFIHTS
jgi:hypothetical protein